ncbi:hypothetical protein [Chryseobacterium balustinum]|uniref:hypothetical protein n=1 Tax=Chryseobacterium balustinum TaxID=246 RepID=UPI003CFAD605
MKKLELKNLKIKKISDKEQKETKGGLLSIGHECSHRNQCERLHTQCWGSDCKIDLGDGSGDGSFPGPSKPTTGLN